MESSSVPLQSRPPFWGGGAMHSRLRQCAHSVLQADHLLHSVHAPSTAGAQHRHGHAVTHSSGNTETMNMQAHPPANHIHAATGWGQLDALSRPKILKVTGTKRDLFEETVTRSHIQPEHRHREAEEPRTRARQSGKKEAADRMRVCSQRASPQRHAGSSLGAQQLLKPGSAQSSCSSLPLIPALKQPGTESETRDHRVPRGPGL